MELCSCSLRQVLFMPAVCFPRSLFFGYFARLFRETRVCMNCSNHLSALLNALRRIPIQRIHLPTCMRLNAHQQCRVLMSDVKVDSTGMKSSSSSICIATIYDGVCWSP